jgi:undecaprenyl diphosphate synthase
MPLITSFAPSCLLAPLQTSTSTSSSGGISIRWSCLQSHHRTNLIDANDGITKHTFSDELFLEKEESSAQLPNGRLTAISNHTKETTIKTTSTELPRHIAFICDGNSRWSTRQSLPKSMGHAAGADRVINVIKALQRYQSSSSYSDDFDCKPSCQTNTIAADDDTEHTITKATAATTHYHGMIEYCTLYAFSTENWTRSPKEINTIFKLMERIAIQYRSHESVQSGKVQIDLLGDMEDERIPPGAKKELQQLQRESRVACEKRRNEVGNNSANILTICLAINYGARADILQAAQKLALSIASGELSPDAVMDESEISKRLCTAHIPDPDLIIRTSGETRLSNFLLWDAAYAELYFTDLLWPDFDEEALEEALVWYGKRKRRFGGRNE